MAVISAAVAEKPEAGRTVDETVAIRQTSMEYAMCSERDRNVGPWKATIFRWIDLLVVVIVALLLTTMLRPILCRANRVKRLRIFWVSS